jgi:hypothetical protein
MATPGSLICTGPQIATSGLTSNHQSRSLVFQGEGTHLWDVAYTQFVGVARPLDDFVAYQP